MTCRQSLLIRAKSLVDETLPLSEMFLMQEEYAGVRRSRRAGG